MTLKKVKHLIPAESLNMGGFPVKQALPTMKVDQVDPFLLLHHAKVKFTKDRKAKHQGVGPHPHRGFSPVTLVLDGAIHHRDSRGNNQVAHKGEVQWMNAGMGIIHSERPTQALVDSGEHQEMIQLWVNSPSSAKMNIPSYQYLKKDEMPVIRSADGKVETKIVAGTYADLTSKTKSDSPLLILWANAEDTAQEQYKIPTQYNCMLYVAKGSIQIKGYGLVEAEQLVVFEDGGSDVLVNASASGAEYIIMAGAPINEKVVSQGPFVMNSETEILRAMRDYQMGKMGILIED